MAISLRLLCGFVVFVEKRSMPPSTIHWETGMKLHWRMLCYFVPWFVVVVAFFVFAFPESNAQTSDGLLEQTLKLPLATPLMAALGLAHAVSGADFPSPLATGAAACVLFTHSGIMLSRRHVGPIFALLVLHLFLLGFAMMGFLHLSKLHSGG